MNDIGEFFNKTIKDYLFKEFDLGNGYWTDIGKIYDDYNDYFHAFLVDNSIEKIWKDEIRPIFIDNDLIDKISFNHINEYSNNNIDSGYIRLNLKDNLYHTLFITKVGELYTVNLDNVKLNQKELVNFVLKWAISIIDE